MADSVELVLDSKAALGEGAIWHAQQQVLYWINIMGKTVHKYNPATGAERSWNVGQMVGTVVPRRSGGLMLAVEHGFASLDTETGAVEIVADPEADLPRNRFNDGKCDPAGRFWAGTMSLDEEANVGSLYMLDTNGSVSKMVPGVSISNGIVWSVDSNTMYYIDTPTGRVDAFDYDLGSGAVSNRRTVITIPEGQGGPDGMTIDVEGMLWVAQWGGNCVTRWNPLTGELLATLAVPASQVTSCAFGGPNLDELYITTARVGLSAADLAKEPLAGGLFRARPGVQGVPAFEYAG